MKKICRPLSLDAVQDHRKERCLHYDGCLDEASALLWPSFSCEGCELYMEKVADSVCYERASSPLAWEL